MKYLTGVGTDIGIEKTTNQDSVMIKVGNTPNDSVAMIILCDGMGGLSKGEVASATVINAFSEWFKNDLPKLLKDHFLMNNVKICWNSIINNQNKKMYDYGKSMKINLGTTITGILFVNNQYLIANVGDSRVYKLTDSIEQITEDQSLVSREVKLGNITLEEAKFDSRRNILLQCIGATKDVDVEFYEGIGHKEEGFLLCSDGFRHEISKDEIFSVLNPKFAESDSDIDTRIHKLIDINKERSESDNITAAFIKLM